MPLRAREGDFYPRSAARPRQSRGRGCPQGNETTGFLRRDIEGYVVQIENFFGFVPLNYAFLLSHEANWLHEKKEDYPLQNGLLVEAQSSMTGSSYPRSVFGDRLIPTYLKAQRLPHRAVNHQRETGRRSSLPPRLRKPSASPSSTSKARILPSRSRPQRTRIRALRGSWAELHS